jgi:hypothetical protein
LKSSENHRMIIFTLSDDHLISSYYQLNVTLRSSDGHLAIILTTCLQLFYKPFLVNLLSPYNNFTIIL